MISLKSLAEASLLKKTLLAVAAMVGIVVIFVGIVTTVAVTIASSVVGPASSTEAPAVTPPEKKAPGASSVGTTGPRPKGDTASAPAPKPI